MNQHAIYGCPRGIWCRNVITHLEHLQRMSKICRGVQKTVIWGTLGKKKQLHQMAYRYMVKKMLQVPYIFAISVATPLAAAAKTKPQPGEPNRPAKTSQPNERCHPMPSRLIFTVARHRSHPVGCPWPHRHSASTLVTALESLDTDVRFL